jgi:Hydrazine synthase alpha subunit middle domain
MKRILHKRTLKNSRLRSLTALALTSLFILFTSATSRNFKEKVVVLDNPLLFALVPPPMHTSTSYGHQMETFGNHLTDMESAPRGGDLCLMNTDGTIRFLTAEAGFGVPIGQIQAENAIAVRQPTIHWSGKRALFSMVIGGPLRRFDISYQSNKWQIYEITNLEAVVQQGQIANIVKVSGQPNYNNISPIYGSDDQIIFTSDAPLFNLTHTYPALDEYESTPINTGIYKLNPVTGTVVHLSHSPSGDTDLFLASDGRILSTRWEHLKRDQQADETRFGSNDYEIKTFSSEAANAQPIAAPQVKDGKPFADARGVPYELFPEALSAEDPTHDPNESLHDFNEFLIWEMSEDGEGHQTMNHAGRHEFGGLYLAPSKKNDPNLSENFSSLTKNQYHGTVSSDAGLFQLKEDPRPGKQGTFYGTWSREFKRFASGRIFEFTMPIGFNPQDMEIIDWTNAAIDNSANNKGHFRNPLMLLNGTMLVSFAAQSDLFSSTKPYHFQIAKMVKANATPGNTEHIAGDRITGNGIEREIIYHSDAATPLRAIVKMNEVDVVEITSRNRPTKITSKIEDIEKQVIAEEQVNEEELRTWMRERNLALIVIRNATERDAADLQQPFNLRVPGGVSTIPKQGKVYDISHFQIFQADVVRGYRQGKPGRRVLATPMHNTPQNTSIESTNLLDPNAPAGSVKIASDGSIAAFVPATRAMTWQTLSPTKEPIVRERQWVTFAPGEVRTCAGCHGINGKSKANNDVPQNKPEALRELLRIWKTDLNDLVTSIPNGETKADGFRLYANYPNPFSISTEIKYTIEKTAHVTLRIYNTTGQVVAMLVNGRQDAGTHKIMWNAKDSIKKGNLTGMYICSLEVAGKVISNKMLVIE